MEDVVDVYMYSIIDKYSIICNLAIFMHILFDGALIFVSLVIIQLPCFHVIGFHGDGS